MSSFRPGRACLAACATLGLAIGAAQPAKAAFTFTITETSTGVTGSGSGSIDRAGLTPYSGGTDVAKAGVRGDFAAVFVAKQEHMLNYGGVTGPASIGPGTTLYFAPSFSDGGFYINSSGITIPATYVDKTDFTASFVFTGKTLSDLGLTAGTYSYTWGSGEHADSFTLNIVGNAPPPPPTGVPEPASAALLGLSLLGFGFTRRNQAGR